MDMSSSSSLMSEFRRGQLVYYIIVTFVTNVMIMIIYYITDKTR